MGLFGSSAKVSSATSAATSGLGAFAPKNTITYSKPFIDVTNPASLVGLSIVLIVGWVAWRRLK